MTASNDRNDRLLELLADRAAVGLGAREQIELAELLVHAQDVDVAAFDKAAASIALASVGKLEKLPLSLAEKIEASALAVLGGADPEGRPASDFTQTHALDQRAPSLVRTQVDPVASVSPLDLEVSEATDFKRTHVMQEPLVPSPADVPAPASMPTLARPGAPYPARAAGTSPVPFRAPAPVTPLAPRPGPAPTSFSSIPFSSPGPTSVPPRSNVVSLPPIAAATRGPSRAVAIGGWLAAAACLLLAIGAMAARRPTAPVVSLPIPSAPATSAAPTPIPPAPTTTVASLTPAELREKLLASEGSARAEWTPTKDPLGKAATGEVVWNKDQQKGTMRFKGLAKNDPSRAQYQLWIFDKTRDDKYPVDGGVFDVDSDTGDVIVPIRATLAVNAPVAFVVTLEKPGGVVVSKREHIVVTAKLPAG